MPRLQEATLLRVETFSDRMLDVVDALPVKRVSRRVLDQISACGTSVGANIFEADEAMSAADFCKTLGIVNKELSESRYWIRLIGRRGWLNAARLSDLEQECQELRRIFGAMISRSRKKLAAAG